MALDKIPLSEVMMLEPGICEPGTAQLRSHFRAGFNKGDYTIVYSPDTGLVHLRREFNGIPTTRSAHVSRVREMVIQSASQPASVGK